MTLLFSDADRISSTKPFQPRALIINKIPLMLDYTCDPYFCYANISTLRGAIRRLTNLDITHSFDVWFLFHLPPTYFTSLGYYGDENGKSF